MAGFSYLVQYGIFTAVAAVLSRILYSVIVRIRNKIRARALGCQSPPMQKQRLPFGLEQLTKAIYSDKSQRLPDNAIQRFKKMGTYTFGFSLLGKQNFVTAEPENIKAMLATKFQDFSIGKVRKGNFNRLFGSGIFTQEGQAWQHSRATLRPQFAREQVSDLSLEEVHVQNMMRALTPDASGWIEQVDLLPLFFRLTLDSATEFIMGYSVGSQLAALPDYQKDTELFHDEMVFVDSFEEAKLTISFRSKFRSLYWLMQPPRFHAACRRVHEYTDRFVRQALASQAREKESGQDAEASDGKEKFVLLQQLAKETQDPLQLRFQILHMLFAGRDTTASLIGWLFYSLSQDSERYQKLRKVVLDEFGTFKHPKDITFGRLKSCDYLRFCLSEALRIWPVVPFNTRRTVRDTTLPRGGGTDGMSPVFVPADTQVDYSIYVMQRRKDIWGDDADEFRPERWEGRKTGWDYIPFNGGPRICIGQQFALTEASFVAVRLMQRFDIMESLITDPLPRFNLKLTTSPGTGVKVRLHEARE
ncbi:Cytochrome P450 52A12 [Lachnellula suecica]|uniref:Cytochrome P450 52A12 n=1 Tax=Lachnellula suecica TaxID=602035 RepID=A0A8T9CDT0_9HELO|nr:Cytochrome P450 52A12 [Lachnellula suecica]